MSLNSRFFENGDVLVTDEVFSLLLDDLETLAMRGGGEAEGESPGPERTITPSQKVVGLPCRGEVCMRTLTDFMGESDVGKELC